MRFLSIATFLLLMVSGCAGHFYRLQPDTVVLYLKAPSARTVEIAASCDHFARQSAVRGSRGLWTVSMPKDTSFRYFYLVDGDYFLPACDFKEDDDFGQSNCIFEPEE